MFLFLAFRDFLFLKSVSNPQTYKQALEDGGGERLERLFQEQSLCEEKLKLKLDTAENISFLQD